MPDWDSASERGHCMFKGKKCNKRFQVQRSILQHLYFSSVPLVLCGSPELEVFLCLLHARGHSF